MKQLVLIRGHSGSGKSTFATTLSLDFLQSVRYLETDDYFINHDTLTYNFDPTLLAKAHQWCRTEAELSMGDNTELIIVANTFTRMWEMHPYLDMAEVWGYTVKVYRCTGDYGSVHNVPAEVIQAQKDRFEDYEGEEYV